MGSGQLWAADSCGQPPGLPASPRPRPPASAPAMLFPFPWTPGQAQGHRARCRALPGQRGQGRCPVPIAPSRCTAPSVMWEFFGLAFIAKVGRLSSVSRQLPEPAVFFPETLVSEGGTAHSSRNPIFGHTYSMWTFPGQGSNLCHGSNPSGDSDNTGSLTCCATKLPTVLLLFLQTNALRCNLHARQLTLAVLEFFMVPEASLSCGHSAPLPPLHLYSAGQPLPHVSLPVQQVRHLGGLHSGRHGCCAVWTRFHVPGHVPRCGLWVTQQLRGNPLHSHQPCQCVRGCMTASAPVCPVPAPPSAGGRVSQSLTPQRSASLSASCWLAGHRAG